MKKALGLAALLLCVLLATGAIAETFLYINTANTVGGVMLMDENGNQISRVAEKQINGNEITWLLAIDDSAKGKATLYQQDANGNWLRTNSTFPLSGSAPAPTAAPKPTAAPETWPQDSLSGPYVSVYPLPENERYQSRVGPERHYPGGGAYKTYKIKTMEALFIEDGWVFVDMTYQTVGRRRLYFPKDYFQSLSGVSRKTLTGHSAVTTATVTPYFGPGKNYDNYEKATLSSGTSIQVFLEEDGWVFAEFEAGSLGTFRMWLPVQNVKAW